MTAGTPLEGVGLVLSDLDGVLYQGHNAIDHAVESLTQARQHAHVGFITNNASRTPRSVADHICSFGLEVDEADVVTSPQAAVRVLARLIEPGSLVLVVGGEGLTTEVEAVGFRITRNADDAPSAVIQGFYPDVAWTHLAQAAFALQRWPEIPWVATNTDFSIPVDGGVAPGNGAMVGAVHHAVGRPATFAGKPEKEIFDVALERFGAHGEALMLGDRLDTDVLGANRAGIKSALVLTGIDSVRTLLACDESLRPSFILGDLRELHYPYPPTRRSQDAKGAHTVEVGEASVRRDNTSVRVLRAGSPIDLTRAAAAIVHDSGLPFDTLEIDPTMCS